jgi:hypothetical protein
MSYGKAKENIIKQIQDDPARFLTEQLSEGQPFYNTALTAFDAEENPTIMQLKERNDDILITVSSWKHERKKLKRVDLVFQTQHGEEWSEVAWEQKRILVFAPVGCDEPYSVMEQHTYGAAVDLFQRLVQGIVNKGDTLEHTWFFPFGTRRAQDIPTLTMSATSKDKFSWQKPAQLSTLQTGA